MLNLDRAPTRASDIAAIDGVVAEWRLKEYCPGQEVKAIQTLQRTLWRRTRALSREYRLALDLDERRRLWPHLKPWVEKFPKVKASIAPWSLRLDTIIAGLRAFDPGTAFPQPNLRTTRVQFRSALIREAYTVASGILKARRAAQDATAARMAAGFLRATCPEICHDLTPEQVRKLVKYPLGKNKS